MSIGSGKITVEFFFRGKRIEGSQVTQLKDRW